jgi:hypothetical protein
MQFNSVNDFLVHVQEELDNNRLILPTLPDIAIKVRSIVNKVGAPFLLHEILGCPIANLHSARSDLWEPPVHPASNSTTQKTLLR